MTPLLAVEVTQISCEPLSKSKHSSTEEIQTAQKYPHGKILDIVAMKEMQIVPGECQLRTTRISKVQKTGTNTGDSMKRSDAACCYWECTAPWKASQMILQHGAVNTNILLSSIDLSNVHT